MAKRKKNEDLKEPGISDLEGNTGDSRSLDYAQPSLGSAPKPEEVEAAMVKAPKEEVQPVAPLKPSVPLRVWTSMATVKADRLAGFVRFAQLEEMRPAPVAVWNERYEAFLKKPTR